jgi:recombination protein RecR
VSVDPIQRAILALSRLPSVGEKTAARLTFFLLNRPPELTQELSEALGALHASVRFCSECAHLTTQDPCSICGDHKRDSYQLCVVEDVSSLMAIERTGVFEGRYHVLHGLISPLDGVGPDDLKLSQLLERVMKLRSQEPTRELEVISALSSSVNGNATTLYLQHLLSPVHVKLTKIATGVPVGANLQYADQVSLAEALSDRRLLSAER